MTSPIPNCPQPETPIRERAWTDAQVEAMRKDAERYRWLREGSANMPDICPAVYMQSRDNPTDDGMLAFGALDRAMDAAMQGAKP